MGTGVRRNRGAIVVVVALAVSMTGLVGTADRPVAAAEQRVLQVPSIPDGIPPAPVVESVGSSGGLAEPAQIRGHDKGQSTLYDNGVDPPFSYWSFGDTAMDTASGFRFIGNTGARTTDLDMSDNIGSWTYDNLDANGDPQEAFPRPPGCGAASGCRVWGPSVAADPDNGRMIGIYHVVGGGLDYYGLGTWSETTETWTPQPIANPVDPAQPYQLWPTGAGTLAFNTGMIIEGGHLYVYACQAPAGNPFRRDCHLARVPTTDPAVVADRAAWRFFTAAGSASCPAATWSADVACAGPLPSGEIDPATGQYLPMGGGAAGSSVFWNDYLGRYMTVYSKVLSNDVVYAVADELEGPWSAPALMARGKSSPVTDPDSGSHPANYAAYAHPEFAEGNGKVQYVTYVRGMCPDLSATSCPPGSGLGSLLYRSQFDILRVVFGTTPSRYQRFAGGETYYGDSGGALRINAAGPTIVDTGGAGAPSTTAANDRHGAIFTEGTGVAGTSAVVRVDSQFSGNPTSLAGLVMRNSIDGAHNGFDVPGGQGYVAVVAAPGGGGVSLRWDSDGDHDLDSRLPASPNGVPMPVWLRLTRTGATTYEGAYSTSSTDGTDGTWTTLGTATVATAAASQDIGIVAAGTSETNKNRAVFTGFEVRPGTVGTWGAAVSAGSSTPTCPGTSTPGFEDQTVRNIVPTSIGHTGTPRLRVRVSNAHGTTPLVVGGATIGLPTAPGAADLVASTVTPLTFGGQGSVTIPAGAEQHSDVVTPTLPGGETLQDRDLAVSLYLPSCTGTPTWHRNPFIPQTNYVFSGDQTADATPGTPTSTPSSWYFASAVDVVNAQALGTVVVLGDSLSDGVGAGPGTRWPEKLADRLAAAGAVRTGVVNQGQAGALLAGATGRFERDVLSQPGVRTVIVQLGVNDLIATGTPPTAAQLVGHYRDLAAQARARGVRILVGTITPLGNNAVSVPARETVRQEVNAFLRQSTEFDGVVDLDAAVRRPEDPRFLRTDFQAFGAEGSVHCNPAGYEAMAGAVDLAQLLQPPRTR